MIVDALDDDAALDRLADEWRALHDARAGGHAVPVVGVGARLVVASPPRSPPAPVRA